MNISVEYFPLIYSMSISGSIHTNFTLFNSYKLNIQKHIILPWPEYAKQNLWQPSQKNGRKLFDNDANIFQQISSNRTIQKQNTTV